jgi:hypothetical protein
MGQVVREYSNSKGHFDSFVRLLILLTPVTYLFKHHQGIKPFVNWQYNVQQAKQREAEEKRQRRDYYRYSPDEIK